MSELIFVVSRSVAEICRAENREQLSLALQNAVNALGFDSFNFAGNKRSKREFITDPTITSWTSEALADYERDRWDEQDPLLAYAASGTSPLLWDLSSWSGRGTQSYREYVKFCGIHGGVTVPLNGAQGTVSALTLLSLSAPKFDEGLAHAAAIIGEVVMLRAAAIDMISGHNLEARTRMQSLTGRQMEILSWVAKGKTNIEIGIILGQTKRAIDYHIIEILKKLNVKSRSEAAVIWASNAK